MDINKSKKFILLFTSDVDYESDEYYTVYNTITNIIETHVNVEFEIYFMENKGHVFGTYYLDMWLLLFSKEEECKYIIKSTLDVIFHSKINN